MTKHETNQIAELKILNAGDIKKARLIAAAPELLAALKKLAADCDGVNLGTVKEPRWAILCEASTLIAKIENCNH